MLGGPVLIFDAVRTARRSRLALLRALYAFLLLFVLFLVYTSWFGRDLVSGLTNIMDDQSMEAREQDRFASTFFHTFLIFQFVALLLLTPAYTAGAIAEEREKGTLQLLLTTQLDTWDILLGKLASRSALLFLVLLAGFPILAILQLLGGVDPSLILAGVALTVTTMVSSAAISLWVSAGAEQTRNAVFTAYAAILVVHLVLMLCFCSCFMVFNAFDMPAPILHLFAAGSPVATYQYIGHLSTKGQLAAHVPYIILSLVFMHGLLAFFFLRSAGNRLRLAASDLSALQTPIIVEEFEKTASAHPPVSDDPILWKELHVERGLVGGVQGRELNMVIVFLGLVFVAQFFLVTLASLLSGQLSASDELAKMHGSVLVPLLAGLTVLRLALRGSGSLSGERDRQTLDSLLTTDLTNEDILGEKWLGCLYAQKGMFIIMAALLTVGLFASVSSIAALPLLTLSLAAQFALALTLGMYCSLVCRTTFRATTVTLLLLLVGSAGHWLIYGILRAIGVLLDWPASTHEMLSGLHQGLTPHMNLSTLAEVSRPDADLNPGRGERLSGAVAAVLIQAVLAAGLWWRIVARFGPLTGRLR